MFQAKLTRSISLLDTLTDCHIACFPGALSRRLGRAYARKMTEWFLVSPDAGMLYVADETGAMAGYCGYFIPRTAGQGSTSSILQYAMREACLGVLRNPLILLHTELRPLLPIALRNLSGKLKGKKKLQPAVEPPGVKIFKPRIGLVVIGVLPAYRGKGVFESLMQGFDVAAATEQLEAGVLSVRSDNERAIAAYKKAGWVITEKQQNGFTMQKTYSISHA